MPKSPASLAPVAGHRHVLRSHCAPHGACARGRALAVRSRHSLHEAAPMSQPIDFRGHWHRIAGADCANAYPAHLEFKVSRYAGAKDSANQGFVMWDAGGYRVESDGIVMIQTATDSQERYRYRLAG